MKWIAPLLAYLAVVVGIFRFQSAWGALLGFHLAIIVSLVIAKPDVPIKVLFTGSSRRWILINVLLCGSSGIALYFLWDRFGIVNDVSTRVEAMGLNNSNWLAFIAYFALINPLVEEYFWRGYLGSSTTGLSMSDVLYSGFHGLILVNKVPTGMVIASLAVLVFAGWFWRQISRADKGLRAPMLGHMAADLAILMAVYWRL